MSARPCFHSRASFCSDRERCDRLAGLSDHEIASHRASYWERVRGYGIDPGGKVLVDKYPLSTLKLPLVAKLFPKAKVVFALPRSARCRAQLLPSRFWRQRFDLSISRPFACRALLRQCDDACRKSIATSSGSTGTTCGTESTGRGFRRTGARALRFPRPWLGRFPPATSPDMLRATARSARRARSRVVRGLNRDGIALWRNYEAELAPADEHSRALGRKAWLRVSVRRSLSV